MFGKEKIVKAIEEYEITSIPKPTNPIDIVGTKIENLQYRVNALEKLIKDLKEAFS